LSEVCRSHRRQVEFMARALIAVDAATRPRQPRYRLRKPRLLKLIHVPPKVQARESRPVIEAVAREHRVSYDVLVGRAWIRP